MKSKKSNLHRGQILAATLKRLRLNRKKIANKAEYSRSAYYKHIADANLDFHILMAYGKAMGHDFTEEFPEMPRYILEDPEESYIKPVTLEQALHQRDMWRDKYLELLEKYNRLIEGQMSK